MATHKELDFIAGEAAFEATGSNLSDLFLHCAEALFHQMAEVKQLRGTKKIVISISGENPELLLHKFLAEIVFLKDFQRVLFKKAAVNVWKLKGKIGVNATLSGQSIEEINSEFVRSDVKAVTFHNLKIITEEKRLKATVVLDI